MLSFRIAWTGLLAAATSQHCRTSCDRRAPGACHVQVGDQCYGCRVYLLLAQDGVLANTPEKPVAEMRRRLDDAAAKKVDMRVGEFRGYREQPAHGHRLLLEDLERQRVAGLPVTSDEFCCHADRPGAAQLVPE